MKGGGIIIQKKETRCKRRLMTLFRFTATATHSLIESIHVFTHSTY